MELNTVSLGFCRYNYIYEYNDFSPLKVLSLTMFSLHQVQVNRMFILYMEDQLNRSIQITPNLTLSDVDSIFLSQALIRFPQPPPDGNDEALILVNNDPNSFIIWESEHQILVSGTANLTIYQSLLRNLFYSHNSSSGDPTEGVRTIEISVTDDHNLTSTVDFVTVTFIPVNDAPIIDLNGLQPGRNHFVTFQESSSNVSILHQDILILDVDNTNLTQMSIILTNPQNESEYLTLTPQSTLLVFNSSNRITVTTNLSTGSPIGLFIDTLLTLLYFNSEDEPSNETRIVSVVVSDGSLVSEPVYIFIGINLVNDVPLLDLDSTSSSSDFQTTFIENGPPVAISSQAVIIDPDSESVSQFRIQFERTDDIPFISINSKLRCFNLSSICSVFFSPPTPLTLASDIISNITFFDNSNEPTSTIRVFYLSVFDGIAWSSSAKVQVHIQSVNDNFPTFISIPYFSFVEENQFNAFVFAPETTDIDSRNSIFTFAYTLKNCYIGCPFVINASTGVVTTSPTEIIDRELISYYELILEVSDGLLNSTTSLLVNVTDQNDNCPRFVPDSYDYTLPINTPTGTSLFSVFATDPDLPPNGSDSILFQVLRITPRITNVTVFEIDPQTGIFYLVVDETEIDPDIIFFSIEIGAIGPSCSNFGSLNNASITIFLVQNTLAPKFLLDTFVCIFSEGVVTGNCIIVASDDDIGSYGSFFYSLIDSTNTFSITDTSGIVTVRTTANLDFESINSYTLTVVAEDFGRPSKSSSAELIINVADVNDNIPVFSLPSYTAVVCENIPFGTTILKVEASDRDSGSFGEIEYYITPTYVPFSIEPNNGEITLKSYIDFETIQSISFNVSAIDGGRNSAMVPVIIQILNNNDIAPSFLRSYYQIILNENITLGSQLPLPSPLAVDADFCIIDQCLEDGSARTELLAACEGSDSNNNDTELKFSILTSVDADFFSIDPQTGAISLAKLLDFENVTFHSITIEVRDQDFMSFAVIMIYVNDTNDNAPTFLRMTYSTQINEEVNIGTSVIQIMAQDLDTAQNSNITFAIQGTTNLFIIDSEGIIYTNDNIDFEEIKEFRLTVTAIDMGLPRMLGTANVIITVLDINDNAPMFFQTFFYSSILENIDIGSFVLFVGAMDLDSGTNAKLIYSIVESTSFFINSTTGDIFVLSKLDFEVDTKYTFEVRATDQGAISLDDFAQVEISILDVNDNPILFDQQVYNISLSENVSPTNLLQISATDLDSSEITNKFFSLTNDSLLLPFIVTPVGTLRNTQSIDFENVSLFSLQAVVYDDGEFNGFTDTATIYVYIFDKNDNPPIFDQLSYEAVIEEHSELHTSVITLSATDMDSGVNAEIEYVITLTHPLLYGPAFAIDANTGLLTVSSGDILDRETYSSVNLHVSAFNPHFPNEIPGNSTAIISITLTDINDNPPKFLNTPYSFSIPENFTPVAGNNTNFTINEFQRFIGKVSASDADTDQNSEITFHLMYSQFLPFLLNSSSGDISTNSALDRERMDIYTLHISAADGGIPSLISMIEVTIYVTDVNDNIPTISEKFINLGISEATSIGTLIYNISTIDYDIGENANFSFTLISNATNSPFMVNTNYFSLYVNSELDRESIDFYSFLIQVSDNGVPSFTSSSIVRITILDENDNSPIILRNTSDIIHILESAPIGVFVSAVYIIDNDLPPYTDSKLSLHSQHDSFNISANGIISTRLPLDFETSREHNITVFAQNIHQPYFISTLIIQVIVINENDEIPNIEINSSNSRFNYFEGHFSLLINPSIDIQDSDSPPFDSVASATISLDVLDTSYNREFVPNTGRIPYSCLNEDRLLKIQGCGTENVALITRQNNGLVLFNGATLYEFTLSLDSSQYQYGEFKDSIPFISDNSGLTISLWIWYQPVSTNISSTILSKAAPSSDFFSTRTLLHLTCVNQDLQVFYNSEEGGNTIVLDNACSLLTESWHHLALVIYAKSEYWRMNLYIDGTLNRIVSIHSFKDESGRLFLGAEPTPTAFNELHNFFNGVIHFLFFSSQVSHSTILCSIGCGEALWLNNIDDNLNNSFSYNRGVLTITGSSSDTDYERLINSLHYINTEDEPQVMIQRLIYQVFDGISNSPPKSVTITLIAVNDYSPELSLGGTDGNFETTFIEESDPVSLIGSMNFSLTDRDSVAFSYIIQVTILNPLQPVSEEILYVTDMSTDISTSYDDFVLTISGYSPIPEFSMILSTITYQNLAGEMVGTNRNISFNVNDNSERFSETRFCLIILIPVNDLPIITLGIKQIRYSEGDPPILLSNQVTIQDNDNTNLLGARVEILNRLDGEEELLLAPSMDIMTDDSRVSAEFNIANGVLYLSGRASLQIYSNLISQVQYLHNITSGNSTNGIREIRFYVYDGLDDSDYYSVFVIFNEIDNPPSIDLNGNLPGLHFETLFIEDISTSILAVSPNLTVVDLDSTMLSWAQVVLKNPIDSSEYISVSEDHSQLVSTYDNVTGILTISPPNALQASISEFVSTIRTLTYNNPSEEPTPLMRTLCFSVSDGSSESEIANTSIHIQAVNDIPSIDLDTTSPDNGYNTNYTEGDSPVYITSRNVSVVDNDNTNFVLLSIRISSNITLSAREEILTSIIPNLTIIALPIYIPSFNATQYTIFLPKIIHVTAVLESLKYSNLLPEPRGRVRILEIYVFDGINNSPSVYTRINIFHTNAHSPSFIQSSYLFRIPENAIIPIFIGKVVARDQDSGVDGEVYYALSDSGELVVGSLFIVRTTGEIYSNTSFDRETIDSFSLDAYAFDSGQPRRTSSVLIMVIVEDENEFPPIISSNISLSFAVLEEQPYPISIGALVATDKDAGQNAEIGFAIVGGDGLGLFSITENGIIHTNFTFDREENDNYELIISIFDQGAPQLSSQVTITVIIIDINDNAPIFTPNFVSVKFLENEPNSYVITLRSTDIDTASHSMVTYQLLGSNLFTIDEMNGDVYTGPNGLDRELVGVHNLVGLAIDFGGFNGTQGFTGFVTLMVIVQDVNDNPPLFEKMNYSAIIFENSEFNTTVISVIASDADAGLNKVVRYAIISLNVPFVIGDVSGIITVSGNIDYESLSQYTLKVLAYDLKNSTLNSSVLVTINIIDINDNFPLFSAPEFSAQVPENAKSNSIITVTASDRDSTSNGQLLYSLLNFQHLFSIHPISGIITNTIPFDYERICQYNLSVIASDYGSPNLSSTVSVFLNIINIEDIPPRFTNTHFLVDALENQPLTSLLNLTAEDYDGNCPNISRDSPPLLIYSIISSTRPFILSLSGELSVAGLDRELVATHILNVSVTDSAGLSDFATITVTVLDVNDNNPTFPGNNNIFQYYVSEAAPLGYVVAAIPANDVDLVDQGRLVFSLRNSFNPKFTINSTGHIILIESLDFESTESSASPFQVQDSLNNTIIGVVFILPLDADDNSPVLMGISTTINFTEGSESIAIFPLLVIRDDDMNFQSLISAQVILSSPEPFNSSLPDACACVVQSCDPGCLEYLTIDLPMNSPGISIVHQLGSKSISITGLASLGFYINLLRTANYNNMVVNPIPTPRTIILRVTDVGQHLTQVYIFLNLVVLNQFPPLLDLDGFETTSRNFETTFLENGIAVAIVGSGVSFMDPDRGTTIISRIKVEINNPLDMPQEYLFFSPIILPAHLRLVLSNTSLTLFGLGSHSEYISLLLAIKYINNADEPDLHTRVISFDFEDGHLTGNTVTTLVKLSGSNDFPPQISPTTFLTQYVEESSPISIVTSNVQIIDQDTFPTSNIELLIEIVNVFDLGGDLIQCALQSSLQVGIDMFVFSDIKLMFSGNVSLESFEDILLNLRYTYRYSEFVNISPRLVMFSISDDPTITGYFTTTTEIQLIPINDQHPSIQPFFSIDLPEDENIGNIISRILFNDGDMHSISTPSFSLQDSFNQTFMIDNNGILSLSSHLDFETVSSYSLTVSVSDSSISVNTSHSISQVLITVIDINDNGPVFDTNNLNVTIREDFPVGHVVLTLQAFDRDTGLNAELVFNLLNGVTDFSLESATGILTLVTSLDFNQQPTYVFAAYVTNPNSSLIDFVSIVINVLDVNNHPPILSAAPNVLLFLDDQINLALNTGVLVFSITDLDPNPTLDSAAIFITSENDISDYLYIDLPITELSVIGSFTKTLHISGSAPIDTYLTLLSLLVYTDEAPEPLNRNRSITFIIEDTTGPFSSIPVTLLITPQYINDNSPILNISGHDSPFHTNFIGNYFLII